MAEGVRRLDHLRAHGPGPYAFGWESLADARLWKRVRGAEQHENAA
jgi:hypothetical protein